MTRQLHQVIIGAGAGDAITSMAFSLQTALRSLGDSDVFAHHIQPEMVGLVRPAAELPPQHRGDVVVYHASYGIPDITRNLLQRDQIVLIYHNITPSEFFLEHQPQVAVELEWGRHELGLIRDQVVLAVAVSPFNAADLATHGYDNVHVLPMGLHPSRLVSVAPDGRYSSMLRDRFPTGYVLAVSQVLPHKHHDHLIQAMHLVQWVHKLELGLVMAGPVRNEPLRRALDIQAHRLRVRNVVFTDALAERQLAAAYRRATVFASMSAHEGLALPPLEAMSFGVPVVARAAGAIADTIGGAGLVLPESSGPTLFSEALAEVYGNEALRLTMQANGHARVRAVESVDTASRFLELLAQVA